MEKSLVTRIGFDERRKRELFEWIREREKEFRFLRGRISIDEKSNSLLYAPAENTRKYTREREIEFLLETLKRFGVNPQVYVQA